MGIRLCDYDCFIHHRCCCAPGLFRLVLLTFNHLYVRPFKVILRRVYDKSLWYSDIDRGRGVQYQWNPLLKADIFAA